MTRSRVLDPLSTANEIQSDSIVLADPFECRRGRVDIGRNGISDLSRDTSSAVRCAFPGVDLSTDLDDG